MSHREQVQRPSYRGRDFRHFITKPPTARQMQILRFCAETVTSNGLFPSLDEIGVAVGIRSYNGIVDHLRLIERKGLLTRGPKGSARSAVITALGWSVLDMPCPSPLATVSRHAETAGRTGFVEGPVRCSGCNKHFFRGTYASHTCSPADLAVAV